MASSMKQIFNHTDFNFESYSKIIIAYSGGLDSTALLHLLASNPTLKTKLLAVHINHGINHDSDTWQLHCEQQCKELDVQYFSKKITLNDHSENSSRNARYEVFNQILDSKSVLVTAHHQSDQAETILFRLFRGTGLSGIQGIRQIRDDVRGKIIRPLLGCSKLELREYCVENNLRWIEDPSNAENNYSRNFIRNKVIPKISSHWPQFEKNLVKTASNLGRSEQLLMHLMLKQNPDKNIDLDWLRSFPKELRSTYLYHWLSDKQQSPPSDLSLQNIVDTFIDCQSDANPKFETKQFQIRKWQNKLYCLKAPQILANTSSFSWDDSEVFVSQNKVITLRNEKSSGASFVIKFNQKGEKLKPTSKTNTRTAKNLFQEHAIPPWIRKHIPYIYHNNKLVSLGFDWSHVEGYDEIEIEIMDMEL